MFTRAFDTGVNKLLLIFTATYVVSVNWPWTMSWIQYRSWRGS